MTVKLLNFCEISNTCYSNINANYVVIVWGQFDDVCNFAERTLLPHSGKYDNSCAGAYEIIFTFDEYEDAIGLMEFALKYGTRARIEMEFYDAINAVEGE